MSLRQKTLAIITMTFIGLMILLYATSRLILLSSFARLEEKNTYWNVTRATNAISDELLTLNSTAGDWATWDDTYAFVEDANAQYITDNLTDSALINLRLNLILFINASGQVVFGKALDLQNEQEIPIPQSLLAHLSAQNPLLHHASLESSVTGIILLPEGPILVVSRPILTSAGTGPIRGTLIMGRYLDANEIKYLAGLSRLSLSVRRFNDTYLPPDFQAARAVLSSEMPVFVQPLDTRLVAGYALLTDIYEQTALILRVDMPRAIYQQGQASISYFMWSLLAVGLVFGTVTILLLEKQVLSRLTHLSQSVGKIGDSGDLSARVPTTGQDELSTLANAINNMLSALEQSEKALREQTRRKELILQTSMDGFIRLDIDGRLREVNPAFCAIVGYSREELFGMRMSDLEVQENFEGTRQRIEAILKTGSDRFETKYRRRDGQVVNMEISINFTEFGQDRFFFAFLRDITERKRVEAEIRRRNRELILLNQIIAASASAVEPEMVLGRACRELALAFEVPRVTATLFSEQRKAAIMAGEYSTGGQLTPLHQTMPLIGNLLFQHLLTQRVPLFVANAPSDPSLEPIRDLIQQRSISSLLILPLIVEEEVVGCLNLEATQPRHFSTDEISLAWSVADQVSGALARTRLTQTHRRLITAIEQTAEIVVITDIEGVILYVNPAFEHITGYSYIEAIGQTPQILKSDKQEAAVYQKLWTTITAGQVWQGRLINKRKDGALHSIDATISPVRDESGGIVNYVAVGRDITRELQLIEQYHQAQKMEAIGRLAGGLAHDLNNLLTAIMGYTGLTLRVLSADTPIYRDIEGIQKSAERAANLTRQLLTFARRQAIEPKVLNLNDLILNLDKMLRRLIGEDIELVTLPAPELGWVKVDPGQFEQVLLNLVFNARDAMPNGGKLIIETANVTLDQDYTFSHTEEMAGEWVLLTVSDNGIGMTEEVKAHIFEPFFTTKEAGKGTGLGLAICFGIIKQNGGHIWVYSEPNQGTIFKIYLPRVREAASTLLEHGQPDNLSQGIETVLLVEDEPSVRELTARILRQQGYTVLEASNGDEALQVAQEHIRDKIDLLLTDMVMPRLGGRALAERLKVMRPGIKVLFISGYTDEAVMNHGLSESEVAFLQKPFLPSMLANKVRQVLDR